MFLLVLHFSLYSEQMFQYKCSLFFYLLCVTFVIAENKCQMPR